jgi:hypothetical protein
MLNEIAHVRQIVGEPHRRWFQSENMDLFSEKILQYPKSRHVTRMTKIPNTCLIDTAEIHLSHFEEGALMPKPTAMTRAIRYLKSNWRNGKTLKEVADRYGVDAGNLERAFRNREA